MMRKFGQLASGGGGSGATASLLHFDGTDGSTTFTDDTGKIWTPTTGVVINAANKKYGTGCGYFPYSTNTNGYMTTPYSADFAFGAGDFTIQFWVNFITTTPNYGALGCLDQIGGTRGWRFYKTDTTNRVEFAIDTSVSSYLVSDPTIITTRSYTHYAVVRDGATLRLYRNGVQVSSAAISGTANAPNVPCVIGALWGISSPVNGHRLQAYMDDFKITKGYCQYPAGATFTPPTGPLSV